MSINDSLIWCEWTEPVCRVFVRFTCYFALNLHVCIVLDIVVVLIMFCCSADIHQVCVFMITNIKGCYDWFVVFTDAHGVVLGMNLSIVTSL